MEIWELVARESIRDVVARYNAAGDAGRNRDVADLFTADATLQIDDLGAIRGREAIQHFFAGLPAGAGEAPRVIRHFTATHQIDLEDETRARGRCYYAVLMEDGLDHWGRYRDVYRRDEGRWVIAERRVSVDGRRPGSWAEANLARLRARQSE